MLGQMMQSALTVTSIIEYGNRVFPHKEIVSKMPDGSWHRYHFADAYQRSKKLASALVNYGIQPGDRVATFAWNHYQHIEMYFGIPGAGAICHPVNLRLSADQVSFIVNHSQDRLMFADANMVPVLEKIAPNLLSIEKYIIFNARGNFTTTLPNAEQYETFIAGGTTDFDWIDVKENDACAMCYTSGTTGNPKGVLYSHRATYLHALTTLTPNAANLSSRDRCLMISPQFHVMAWGFPFMAMLGGCDIILPSIHLQPAALIDIIQKEKVTIANGVPTIWLGIFEEMMKNPPAEKLPLKEYVVGGSALPAMLIERFEKHFGIPGVHAWGMTETTPVVTFSRLQNIHDELTHGQQVKIRAKQGIELPGVEIRVVKENGTVAPRDGETVGEFQVRGNWIINSYYKLENDNEHFTADGWFKTGDVGTIDAQGYMHITDRTKDLIKSGGEWISSVELENALMGHPKVKEACVIAIPDEKWVERPLACVVFRDGESATGLELQNFLLPQFAKYQVPEYYVPLKEIPKTGVGKFDKKVIRRMFAETALKNFLS